MHLNFTEKVALEAEMVDALQHEYLNAIFHKN